jgi:hypothetical protein
MSKQIDRDIALVSNALAIKQAEVDKLKAHLKNCIIFLDKIGIDPIKIKADVIDMDAYSIGRMMLNYCRLSPEGKRRARLIFKQLLTIVENDDTAKDVVQATEMRNDEQNKIR